MVFSLAEKNLIFNLVENHEKNGILKSRDNSRAIKGMKDTIWNGIYENFIASSVSQQKWSIGQVKECFKNKCKKVKSDVCEIKKLTKMTGGGKGPIDLSEQEQKIADFLGDELKPLDNPFDSDAAAFKEDEVIPLSFSTPEDKVKKRKIASDLPATSKRDLEHAAFMEKMELEKKVLHSKLDLIASKKYLIDLKIRKLSDNETTFINVDGSIMTD